MNRTRNLLIWFLLIGIFIEFTPATAWASRKFQQAVVVSVQKYDKYTPRRRNPSDAPVKPDESDYDISIRLNCWVYVGRYESAFDDLPSAFAAGQSLRVNLEKHVLHVAVPGGREVKMAIVRRYADTGDSCSAVR